MTDIDVKKKNKSNPAAVGVGLAVGAALGATMVALSDKNNQKKVKKVVNDVKTWADKTTEKFSQKSQNILEDARVDLENTKKDIKEPKRED